MWMGPTVQNSSSSDGTAIRRRCGPGSDAATLICDREAVAGPCDNDSTLGSVPSRLGCLARQRNEFLGVRTPASLQLLAGGGLRGPIRPGFARPPHRLQAGCKLLVLEGC